MLKNRLGSLVAVLILIVIACDSIAQTAETQPAKAGSTVVVPAGTEIKVSFTQPRREMRPEYVLNGKVAAPVRVGTATAIPAGSQAAITVVPGFYSEENSGNKRRQVENAVELTSVIVGGIKYNVVTNSIKLIPPTAAGLDAEVGFVLVDPLDIQEAALSGTEE